MAKKKILIIEDDGAMVTALTILLKGEYDVSSAKDGAEGLDAATKSKPDLIILDLLMPVQDGFAVSKALKADKAMKDIPVIALSSFTELYGMSFEGEEGKSSLPTEVYLTKPVDPPTLLRLVKKFIG